MIKKTLGFTAILAALAIGTASIGSGNNTAAASNTGNNQEGKNITATHYTAPPNIATFVASQDTAGLTAFAPFAIPPTVAINAPNGVQADVRKLGKTDTTAGAITGTPQGIIGAITSEKTWSNPNTWATNVSPQPTATAEANGPIMINTAPGASDNTNRAGFATNGGVSYGVTNVLPARTEKVPV